MSEKTEYPELRKELSRLIELQSKNFLTNEADNLIKELQLVLGDPSPALQDAVLFKGKTIANGTTVYGTYHYSNDKKHHYILSRENFIETDGRQTLHNKEVSEVVSESIRQINSIKNDLLLQDAAKEKSYTIDEIRKYLLSQDSFGDVMYNLNEESFDEANK